MIHIINKFARMAATRSEIVAASMILLMIVMMVIPIPPDALDVLLAINISIAILLVVSAVLLDSPMAMSSFPAILLITTLFRLALTISTTRQILLEADAGSIIQTFGEFVVGGNVAVGLIIFLIISIVNFLVVTKGSERIAEVAARFSLDGMPGRQMSIDSDLRAGLIGQNEAKQKRNALQQESQLFGAMDGAIKFVKNDAIAGLVIMVVNMVGGLAIGMTQLGMDFSTAASTYTILSVGDGLVGIIPSLLTSISAGLIVTRVTKNEAEDGNTAQDIIRELGGNLKALQISAVLCLIFAFVPGMPTLVFGLMSVVFLVAWYKANQRKESEHQLGATQQFKDLLEGKDSILLSDLMETKTFAPLEVRLPKSLNPLQVKMLQSICRIARNRRVEHFGVILPLFEFDSHDKPNIEFCVFGVPVLTMDPAEHRPCALATPQQLAQLGISSELLKDSISGLDYSLVDPQQVPALQAAGIAHLGWETWFTQRLEMLILQKVKDLFTLSEFNQHMNANSKHFGEHIKELDRVLPALKVVDILQRLLIEDVSIRNLRFILNGLIEWGQKERDPLVITEQIRRLLVEQLSYQYADPLTKKLSAFVLTPDLEQLIRESTRHGGSSSFVDIDSKSLQVLINMIRQQIEPHLHKTPRPVLLTSMDTRPHVRQIIEGKLLSVGVLSYQEISQSVEVDVLGHIELIDEFESVGG